MVTVHVRVSCLKKHATTSLGVTHPAACPCPQSLDSKLQLVAQQMEQLAVASATKPATAVTAQELAAMEHRLIERQQRIETALMQVCFPCCVPCAAAMCSGASCAAGSHALVMCSMHMGGD
jgi:hypothetical protein